MLKIFKKIKHIEKYRLDEYNFFISKGIPHVKLTPILRYNPFNISLEDLLNDHKLSQKLSVKDISYCNYIFGYLVAKDKVNIYKLTEILVNEQLVKFYDIHNDLFINLKYSELINEEIFNKIDRSDLRKILTSIVELIPNNDYLNHYKTDHNDVTDDVIINLNQKNTLRIVK